MVLIKIFTADYELVICVCIQYMMFVKVLSHQRHLEVAVVKSSCLNSTPKVHVVHYQYQQEKVHIMQCIWFYSYQAFSKSRINVKICHYLLYSKTRYNLLIFILKNNFNMCDFRGKNLELRFFREVKKTMYVCIYYDVCIHTDVYFFF